MNLTFTIKSTFIVFFALILGTTTYSQGVGCSSGDAGGYPCNDVNMFAHLTLADMGCGGGNDIWGWTDPMNGKEYVLFGCRDRTSFIDISDPVNPVILGDLLTHTSATTWRDIKVFDDHAFIVSEAGGHGMQVFDLTRLRDVINPPITFTADTVLTALGNGLTLGNSHNIVVNEGSGFAYTVGNGGLCSGGLTAIDINDPLNPTFAGCFEQDGYTHDAQCVNYIGPDTDYAGTEICFNSNTDALTIVDVTDKTDMTMVSSTGYPDSRYTHQGWATEDHQYFLVNDELDESNNGHNTRTHIFDIRDLDAPSYMGFFESTESAIDHNLYIKGDYAYMSNYRAGLRIVDISDIANGNLNEVAFFDVYPNDNNANFSGTWSNYPYFASEVIAVSSIGDGLFLLKWEPTLSVELTDFTAKPEVQDIVLNWSTATEKNHDSFVIERRTDDDNFIRIGEVDAVGNSNSTNSYIYRDNNVIPGINYYYRLREVAADGGVEYSKTVSAKVELDDTFTGIYPNPTERETRLILKGNAGENIQITITDASGRVVNSQTATLTVGTNILDIDMAGVSRGIYFIQIESAVQDRAALRLIKM